MEGIAVLQCFCFLILSCGSSGRVLVEDSFINDYGSHIQWKGVNFTVNGKPDRGESCFGKSCTLGVVLPPEISNTINQLVKNASFIAEKDRWLMNLHQSTSQSTNQSFDQDLEVHSRKKRLAPVIIGALITSAAIGGSALLGGLLGKPKTSQDPYAEKRFLMEKDRSKMESIRFCTKMCAEEWGQWETCTRQCGSGKQTRTRNVDHEDPLCVGKWLEFFNATFECPHLATQERSCNVGCPNGGEINENGDCNCFDGWEGTCCERKIYCPYPGQPQNGETILGVTPSTMGSIAMFKCNEGFVLDGSRHAVCKSDKNWSEVIPECKRIQCTSPAMTSYLKVMNVYKSYDFGQSIYYQCEKGYVLQGPESQTCHRGGDKGRWSSYTPQCTARECPAPTQTDVPFGIVQGGDYSYNSSITFQCWQGYDLIGLETLTCTKSGRWDGFFPSCQEISCTPPYPPVNGDMQLYGKDTVVFSCQEGYRLSDDTQRVAVCNDEGQWSVPTPTCQAIACDGSLIENVENGFVNGGIYRYPHSVKFGCYPGYLLQGLDEVTCEETGEWSGEAPVCRACPADTYMEEWSTGGVCTECPENSHTSTAGSTSRQHCICNAGFKGPNGGPCQEIKCALPNVPINGGRGDCEVKVGQTCSFTCDAGYIPSGGSGLIECLANGEWSNQGYTCTACAADMYNPVDEPNICLPCPEHMMTEGLTGQGLEGCVCTIGWEGPPGGNCTDVDECELELGDFGCEDRCINTPGSFYCHCSIPGSSLNANGRTCDLNDTCPALDEDDAPINGALVCDHSEKYNTRFCSGRCNEGFDIAAKDLRPSNYETCGPHTGFTWSFQKRAIAFDMDPAGARIFDCIPEFFPGMKMAADIFYLSGACDELTEDQQNEVKTEFVQVLKDDEVCADTEMSCSIDKVQIICGKREKRDANGVLWKSVDFNFEVNFINITHMQQTADCDTYVCPYFKIPQRLCKMYCKSTIRNYGRALILHAEKKLKELAEGKLDRVRFSKMEQLFEPEQVFVHDKEVSCPRPGQEYVEGKENEEPRCFSCQEGHFLSDRGKCEKCPAGTHQLLVEKTSCNPCPLGSFSEAGWAYCLSCEEGFYGKDCKQKCSCVHGKCDTITGDCVCEPGYEGPECSVDVDRCQAVSCPDGKICLDKIPPEDGFICV